MSVYLVFEYVKHDLKDYIKSKGKLNSFEIKNLARQLLEGRLE